MLDKFRVQTPIFFFLPFLHDRWHRPTWKCDLACVVPGLPSKVLIHFFVLQVKIWFQNRRYKTKRRQLHQENNMPTSARKVAVKVLVKDDQIVYNRDELVRPIIYPSIPMPGFHLYWPYHPFHVGWKPRKDAQFLIYLYELEMVRQWLFPHRNPQCRWLCVILVPRRGTSFCISLPIPRWIRKFGSFYWNIGVRDRKPQETQTMQLLRLSRRNWGFSGFSQRKRFFFFFCWDGDSWVVSSAELWCKQREIPESRTMLVRLNTMFSLGAANLIQMPRGGTMTPVPWQWMWLCDCLLSRPNNWGWGCGHAWPVNKASDARPKYVLLLMGGGAAGP